MAYKLKHKNLEGVVEQLHNASKMHAKQADIVENHIKEMGGPLTKKKKGKKDACYHKVKSRVKVWPSAYASGQLVQCRKRGAANWGKKSKA